MSAINIPKIGYGTWLGKEYYDNRIEREEWYSGVVKDAIKAGFRHIDTAQIYGTEPAVGRAVAACIAEGVVSRQDMFLATKVWNNSHSRERTISSLKQKSLKNLRTDYLDLYIIHWPQAYKEDENDYFAFEYASPPADIDYIETYKAIEECVDDGLVKYIGLSNFNVDQLRRVLSLCRIRPSVLQIEFNPYVTQVELRKLCSEEGIVVTGYCPLGGSKAIYQTKYPELLSLDCIKKIGERHGKTPAQVALRWSLHHGVLPIAKTINRARMEENLQVEDFQLSSTEIETLDSLNANLRAVEFKCDLEHPLYPFRPAQQ